MIDFSGMHKATLEDLARLLIAQERLRIFDGSKLGSGNYGEVVRGILDDNSPNRKEVAVKRLKAVGARGEHVRLAKVSTIKIETYV